jgi:PAS domain S-box-containing protein
MGIPPSDVAGGCHSPQPVRHDSSELRHVARLLQACEPCLLLLADAAGGVVAADDLGTGAGQDAARPLAVDLVGRLGATETCSFEVTGATGPRLGFGVRLADDAQGAILGGLLSGGEPSRKRLDGIWGPLMVCGTLAWMVNRCRLDESGSRVQAQQLRAEHDALQTSHRDAIAAAVAERDQRLREQRDHMAQIQAVLMTAADGIITVNETGEIESFNEAARWMFGYSAAEVMGRNVSMLMPPPHCHRHAEYLAHYVRTGKAGFIGYGREVTGQRKDGSTFPLELSVSEVLVGGRRKFTAIARDISERKKAEAELKRLHLQNEMILNSAAEGIFGLDRSGRTMFVNPAAARMLGCEPADLIGRRPHAVIHHTKRSGKPYPPAECPIAGTLREGTTLRVDNEVFWRRDGTSFPAEYASTPMRDKGEIVGAVVTFSDITQRKLLERQLAQAQKLESIGQLAAGIAHEINTPTQYIGDNVRFLDDAFRDLSRVWVKCNQLCRTVDEGGVPEGPQAEVVEDVVTAFKQADLEFLVEEIPKAIGQSLEGVERVARIVRSMKVFSHPGSEEMQAIDLNQAIRSTLTVSRNEWKYVAEAVTDLAPNLPMVTCLPAECNQVLLNLVINAAHAISEKLGEGSTEKGIIRISTRRDEDHVEIRLEDTGTGIAPQFRAKVFDPFFTTKALGRGTGQGLAIAYSVVVEKHGGTIHFETEVGKGTTFIIRLPINQRQASSRDVWIEEADPVCR